MSFMLGFLLLFRPIVIENLLNLLLLLNEKEMKCIDLLVFRQYTMLTILCGRAPAAIFASKCRQMKRRPDEISIFLCHPKRTV